MKNHILKTHAGDKDTQECRILKIEGLYDKGYWLYVAVPVAEPLEEVDFFLRHIWLECCGHMSAFFYPKRVEINMGRKLKSFATGEKLLHHYDFGTTTETVITVMENIWMKPQKDTILLLARNIPPVFQCAKCGKTAQYICMECAYQTDNPFFCAQCSKEHEEGEEMMLPITNSPRMGECGYSGEFDTNGIPLTDYV